MLCRRTASSLVAQAPAKLNLFLRVVGKRPDGYHDIETVMTAINLYDTLIFRPAPDGRIRLSVRASGPWTPSGGQPEIPADPSNLVYRAAALLQQHGNTSDGVDITLIKRIPSAAGLGGGSSDAAATLAALNQFWSLGMDRQNLCELASQLGSDVPFFLGPTSTAICRGRGEIIEAFPAQAGLAFVIAKPNSGLSTPAVYRECRPEPAGAELGPLCRGLAAGRAEVVARHLRNDLESPARRLNPDVERLSCLFRQQPVRGHQLSGSGTAYFGACDSFRQATAVAARLRHQGIPWVCVVQSRS